MQLLLDMLDELRGIAALVGQDRFDRLLGAIREAPRVYVAGRGRSGLIARMFAMRLMHLGLSAYAVDEVVTPAIGRGDLLLVCSGSGETASLRTMADKAKALGARVLLITANEGSHICRVSDGHLLIPGYTPKNAVNAFPSIQPMGSQFEQLTMLVLDALVLNLKQALGVSEAEMMARHANLE